MTPRRRWIGLAAFTPAGADVAEHRAVAEALDAAGFDALLAPDRGRDGADHLDAFTLLAALVPVTTRLGLVAGAGTTLHEPYTVARKLASLDHLSGGRAGWLTGAGATAAQAAALGRPAAAPPGRAAEFAQVVRALWDSFADGAVVRDREAGRYYDPAGLHPPEHEGEHFRVRGPLNISRPPQGHPLVVSGGADDIGADVVLAAAAGIADGARAVVELDDRRAAAGLDADGVRVWQLLDLPAGSASGQADVLERWFTTGAADGFVLRLTGAAAARRAGAGLVPELRRRGFVAPEPVPGTLRRRLGLARPDLPLEGIPA